VGEAERKKESKKERKKETNKQTNKKTNKHTNKEIANNAEFSVATDVIHVQNQRNTRTHTNTQTHTNISDEIILLTLGHQAEQVAGLHKVVLQGSAKAINYNNRDEGTKYITARQGVRTDGAGKWLRTAGVKE
jgi:hypothetical protein